MKTFERVKEKKKCNLLFLNTIENEQEDGTKKMALELKHARFNQELELKTGEIQRKKKYHPYFGRLYLKVKK